MDDPTGCLLHKDRTLISNSATISLERWPDTYNAWSSIYRGLHLGRLVSVRVWRGGDLISPSPERTNFLRKLEREIVVWQALSHPNIASVYGIMFTPGKLPAVVTSYYSNGDINNFVLNNPCVDLKELLLGVGTGLQHLHQSNPPIAHGDVRGCNILITEDGIPVLTDIGLGFLPTPPDWTIPSGDSARWMAPEIMDPHSKIESDPDCLASPMSDVYSFGMTMLEVYTGKVPFSHRRFYVGAILEVMQGKRPRRPNAESAASLTDEIWCIIQSCWAQDPYQRPNMESINSWLRLLIRVEAAGSLHSQL
ncbi:kinase-like domain-containing protein [Lentinula raphanica]|nr:kinase-like domain-containing protein [Lentinula raphanica]